MLKAIFRKSISVLMAAVLLVTLFPALAKQVEAAAPNYFIPDNQQIANKANPTEVSRENSYVADTNRMTIAGTYKYVSSDSITVRVDQLINQSGKWDPDPQRYFTAAANPLSDNRFEIRNLELFSGFNKVTITGKQGNIERSDTFYIVYDDAPYLQSMKVRSDNSSAVDLNEGAAVVMEKPSGVDSTYEMQVYIDGKANNVKSILVNGRSANVLEDGTFFVPPVKLNPGKNELDFELENQSNKVSVKRTIYYYDPDQPYYKLDINHAGDGIQSLLSGKPVLTDGSTDQAVIEAGLILPYSNVAFDINNVTVTVNDPNNPGNNPVQNYLDQIVSITDVPANDGSIKYRLVEFKTKPYKITTTGLPTTGDQAVAVQLEYDEIDTTVTRYFSYLANQRLIKDIYLVEYDSAANKYVKKSKLDNSEVQNSTFYIQVEADKDIASGAVLNASLLPLGTLRVEHVRQIDNKTNIYKVTDFPTGQQQIRFSYAGTAAPYQVMVNYVSKNFIYVENYYDGQTITLDSRQSNKTLDKPKVKLIGFDANAVIKFEYSVNGITPSGFNYNGNLEFDLDPLVVGNSPGQLNYGENRLVLRAIYTDDKEIIREVTKEIRLYIVDTNVSTIERFEPVIIPSDGRAALSNGNDYNDLNRIFIDSPDILYKNDRFSTSLKKVDIVFKAGGANQVKLLHGGEVLAEFKTTNDGDPDPYNDRPKGNSVLDLNLKQGYDYDYYGNPKNFIFRLQNFDMSETGSYAFTLELKNNVGATSVQRIEIVRELASFRVLAPQPTVGDRIVVNKNFVHFDIEAEGATEVLINGERAEKRSDYGDRFILDYVGLKPQKDNAIKIVIDRPAGKINSTVNVYYAYSNQIGAQYKEQISRKHSMFEKNLELTFPKGTILRKAYPGLNNNVEQFYEDTKLLFGIADPSDGVVERMNDYGNIINYDPDQGSDNKDGNGHKIVPIEPRLSRLFTSMMNRDHFTPISDIYWISGGVGEAGRQGTTSYKPATNGLNPYSLEGTFTLFEPARKLVPTKRGELTIKYNDSVVDNAGTNVTVFFFNDKGQWVNLGGEVDPKKNTITVPFDDFGYYMVAKLRYGFNDITNHPWARNVLQALYSKGVMPNLRTEDFGVDDYTTRGEFAALLVKSLNIPLNYDGVPTFVDVNPGDQAITWSYEYLETAARAGIIDGLANRYFAPTQRLKREQAAAMIARALELKMSINDEKLLASLEKSFKDAGDITYYARTAVEAVNRQGIMVGEQNPLAEGEKKPTYSFHPKSDLTRAEAGQIAVRLLQKSTKMFPKNLN
ncbi:S-layer homology domain-containing protein [Paenibacillus sp. J2TS4]|uniref:S-layer homology domain-containing protein n=1 Tax=Paenibacillus sp. J2TS4 TaxID=2807194 RepID=UPI001B2B3B8A|nr:S-layer homology domain-containing protein [Paenibacillus sp. J2TS4]GIP35582.1 hypothetical protein J2TS4_47920 [Paenibacillus sp. J2TS4]